MQTGRSGIDQSEARLRLKKPVTGSSIMNIAEEVERKEQKPRETYYQALLGQLEYEVLLSMVS